MAALSALVPSLETCRDLRDAGFPQDASAFVYGPGGALDLRRDTDREPGECAAPTLAEVLAAMPPRIIRPPVNVPGPAYGTFYRTLSASESHSATPYVVVSYVDAWNAPMLLKLGGGTAQRVSVSDDPHGVEAAARLWLALAAAGHITP